MSTAPAKRPGSENPQSARGGTHKRELRAGMSLGRMRERERGNTDDSFTHGHAVGESWW